MLYTLACQPSSRVAIFFEQFSRESLKICITYRCNILLHFHPDLFCYWLISLHKVVPKVWLFTLELWVPEVPKHVKDVERGRRKMRIFFLAVLLLCEAASPVCSVAPPALWMSVRLHVILPLFRLEISADSHCSTHRSAATGCSAQYLCTPSCL